MAIDTLTVRGAAEPPERRGLRTAVDRVLGHPLAFLGTTAILLAIFGATFVVNPDRVAPTKDPAYYTWRTEALISDPPERLLEITGPFGVFAGGYRVTAPVIGAFLRQIADISLLRVTVLLMVVLPVGLALLLAGFAYRQRRDPLIWHAVALGSASLFLTPPFIGYLDNLLCLFFLAASLYLLGPARRSWAPRFGIAVFLLLAGLTHPTTLAIFCVVLAGMTVARAVVGRGSALGAVRDDAPMLLSALAGAAATYLCWKLGIWGEPASLSESALPPPYGSDFFMDRMMLWVDAMQPLLNGPLFVLGVVGLLMAGRRAADDDLSRVSLVWLAPLAGLFGAAAGLTYPYYRFFNTTLAWVLLVGIGMYFAVGFFLDRASAGGASRLALVGVVAIGVIIVANFATGLRLSHWNEPAAGWLSSSERADMDALRQGLRDVSNDDRPVIFIVDDEPPEPFQIYGFAKLAGNTSRYGLPAGAIDNGYEYLGSLENFTQGRPTIKGEATYDKLSRGFLEDATEGMKKHPGPPVVVVAEAFNQSGANAGIASGEETPVSLEPGEDVLVVHDGRVEALVQLTGAPTESAPVAEATGLPRSSPAHLLRVLLGLLLLMLPGWLAVTYFVPDVRLPDGLGMVPALSIAMLTVSGIVVLAVARSPFSLLYTGVALGAAIVTGAILRLRSRAWGLPAGDADVARA